MTAQPLESFHLDRLVTPIGTALLVTDADGVLRALDWDDYEAAHAASCCGCNMAP